MTNSIQLEMYRCGESSIQTKPILYAEEFIAAFDAPGGISQGVNFQRLIQVTDTRFIGISEMDDIEIAVNKEGPGIDWLDRHEHLVEKYENGSRTDSCSGIVVHSYDKDSLS